MYLLPHMSYSYLGEEWNKILVESHQSGFVGEVNQNVVHLKNPSVHRQRQWSKRNLQLIEIFLLLNID
jgi:hypothetical protein